MSRCRKAVIVPFARDGNGGLAYLYVVAVGRIVLTSRDYIAAVIGYRDGGFVFGPVVLKAVLGQGDLRVGHNVRTDGCTDSDGVTVLVRGIAQHLGINSVGAYICPGGDFGGIRDKILRIDHNPIQRHACKLLDKLLRLSGVDQACLALWLYCKCRLALSNLKCCRARELVIPSAHTLHIDRCRAHIGIIAVGGGVINIVRKRFALHNHSHGGLLRTAGVRKRVA